MNPHVIVVYESVLARSANELLQQLSDRASDLHAVGSGFISLSDSFFVSGNLSLYS